jgi:hypothetical protein
VWCEELKEMSRRVVRRQRTRRTDADRGTSRAFVERKLFARTVGRGSRARGGKHGRDGDDLGRWRRVLVKDNGTQGARRDATRDEARRDDDG